MITFGSDVADLILQRTLGENTLGLNNSINRMTTGYKVNQAKDNAAGYSIITDLSKKISYYGITCSIILRLINFVTCCHTVD